MTQPGLEGMHIHNKIYQFAASAGALEGYVYGKKKPSDLDLAALSDWIGNLTAAYQHLPEDVRERIQPDLDRTLGRSLHSMEAVLGKNSDLVCRLAKMIRNWEQLPSSPDDFSKRKWFDESR